MMNKKLRTALMSLSVFFAVWFTIPVIFSGIVNIGNVTGIVLFVLLFIAFLKSDALSGLFSKLRSKKSGKVLLSIAAVIVSAVIIVAGVETVFMVSAAVRPPEPQATVVVLGCRVYGERPSRMMVARLKAAKKYLDNNPESACILSGGQGADEDISEAECMYRYLVANGVSPDRLYKEDKSTSTRENLAFSKEIIEREELNSNIAIATNEFHEYRAQEIAKALGLESGAVSGVTEIWILPTYYVRELYGILYEWIG